MQGGQAALTSLPVLMAVVLHVGVAVIHVLTTHATEKPTQAVAAVAVVMAVQE